MAEEFVPMQKAAEELGISADALKQVISKREISALLDGGTFKIRRSELERYKSRRQSEETITLPADEAVEAEVAEAEEVVEAAAVEEPTLEAIEETAETVDTEITLDDLDTVKEEPPTATPSDLSLADEPATVELASGEATEEIGLGDGLEVASLSDDIPLEGEESKTVSLEAEGGTQAMEVGPGDATGDLDEPSASPEEGLEARVHVLEARPQGSPFFAAVTVLTSLVLIFVGTALWGFLQDHVPGYMEWMLK